VQVNVSPSKREVGSAAAKHAAKSLQRLLAESESVRIVAATGASQLDFLQFLTAAPGIDWPRVEMFHLDEYIGLSVTHPASFRNYLMERFIRKTGIRRYQLLDGEQNPADVVRAVGQALKSAPIDLAFVGIGENAHLAFNDPPADFETDEPYLIVELEPLSAGQRRLVQNHFRGSRSRYLDVRETNPEEQRDHRSRSRCAESARRKG